MRGWRRLERIATVAALGSASLLLAAPVGAVEPTPPWTDDEIQLGPAHMLFNDPDNDPSRRAGTWVLATELVGDEVVYTLDLQMAAARTELDPGPAVVFWQPVVTWSWDEFSDPPGDWTGPIERIAFFPSCDETGACAARLRLTTPSADLLATARGAASQPTLSLNFTVVRTYGDGSTVMVMPPDKVVDSKGGSIAAPRSSFGIFFVYHVMPLRAPRIVDDGRLDYGSGVVEALAQVSPGSQPTGPVTAINVWDPPRPDPSVFELMIDISFDAPCPGDRVFLLTDAEANDRIMLEIDLAGEDGIQEAIELPTDHVFDAWIGRRSTYPHDPLQFAQIHRSRGGRWELVASADSPYQPGPISCTKSLEGHLGVGQVPGAPIPDPRVPDTAMPVPGSRGGELGWALVILALLGTGLAARSRDR